MQSAAEHYFNEQFEQELLGVGAELFQKYSPLIKAYREVIIPFEKSRVNEHQSIIFENSSLEQNKLELMRKVEQERADAEKLEIAMNMQRTKISEYQRKIQELEQLNIDNLSVIESLRIRNQDYREAIDHKNASITELEKDKQILLEKYQTKETEYTLVLENCMRDKNLLADRLNSLNEMEEALHEKEKDLKAQQFYLKKQQQQFQESSMKKRDSVKQEKKEPRIFRTQIFPSSSTKTSVIEENIYGRESQGEINVKNSNSEILRFPMRKLVKHHQSEIYQTSFNYNGNLLASCGGDRYIKVFDVIGMKNTASISSQSAESVFISVALDYSGDRLLSGSTDNKVNIYQSHTGKHLHSFLGHGSKVNSVCWTSSKERCISGSEDKQLKIWDIEKASNIFSVSCQKSVKVLRSNNVEPVVYTGHGDGSVRIYSVSQGNAPVSQIRGVIDFPITSLTLLSNRHQVLATSLEGSTVHLLDLKMNKVVGKYENGDFFNSATQATISPSEGLVLAGNCDGTIFYWNRHKGDLERKVTAHDSAITSLNYHFMSSVLASGDKEGSLILWQ